MAIRKGQEGVMGAVVTLVAAVIGIVVLQQVINDQNLTGLTDTIVTYVPVMAAVSLLVVAGVMAYGRIK